MKWFFDRKDTLFWLALAALLVWVVYGYAGSSVFKAGGINLLYAVMGGAVLGMGAMRMLRLFDKSAGIEWREDVWDKIAKEPAALAHYHGLRILGALLGWAIIGAAVILASI